MLEPVFSPWFVDSKSRCFVINGWLRITATSWFGACHFDYFVASQMNSVTKVWTHQLLAATWTIWECAMPCCKLSEAIARLPFIALGSTGITKGWENTIFQNYALYFCLFGPWIWGHWGLRGMKPFAWFDALFGRCFLFGLAWAMRIAHHCTMFARADRSFLFIIGVRVNIFDQLCGHRLAPYMAAVARDEWNQNIAHISTWSGT